jgi:hypothetical protein
LVAKSPERIDGHIPRRARRRVSSYQATNTELTLLPYSDPDELRGGRRAYLGPSVGQVVLDGRVCQAKAVSGGLLRSGDEHSGRL